MCESAPVVKKEMKPGLRRLRQYKVEASTYLHSLSLDTRGADEGLIFLVSERPLLGAEAPYRRGRKRLRLGLDGERRQGHRKEALPGHSRQDLKSSEDQEVDRFSVY